MKTKIILSFVLGILLIGLAIADLTIGITPRDETLDTKLDRAVKERLDNEFRDIHWNRSVIFVDNGKEAFGTLQWEWYNGTDWISQQKTLNLWVDYNSESWVCDNDYEGLCLEGHNIPVETFLKDRMVKASDKFFMKTYKRLPDVAVRDEEDVGEKDIRLTREVSL